MAQTTDPSVDSQSGFAKGCLYIDIDSATVHVNEGTNASTTWTTITTS